MIEKTQEMKSDAQVEDEAVDYFLDENLDPEMQMYLMEVIDTDPTLERIIETILMRAIEVSDEGLVEGPGDGTSDDIPARLSDGEFVFTAKAVQVIGVENLERMMAEAENSFDAGNTAPETNELGRTPDSLLQQS